MDPLFKVKTLSKTPRPQLVTYMALHQDYSEGYVAEEKNLYDLSEEELGRRVINSILKFEHFGPLEHSQIVFSTGYFPHSVMVQARTHRVGCSFDVQSMRYTGERIRKFVNKYKELPFSDYMSQPDHPFRQELEELFYLRPLGFYTDRQGKKYEYTQQQRYDDLFSCFESAINYTRALDQGRSEEHARGLLCSDYRQHFVVSFSLRALMHFLDLRAKKDAQLEIQQLCELMMVEFEKWAPEIADWYKQKRWGKARLSP